jgi:hypothetical protein
MVPKQISTGDRTILGPISQRGNRYLRVLFVQAAWVLLVRVKHWERYGLKAWIEAAEKDCTTMCWRSHSPINLPVSSGPLSPKNVRACDSALTHVSLAPCSRPSRHGLETPQTVRPSRDGLP